MDGVTIPRLPTDVPGLPELLKGAAALFVAILLLYLVLVLLKTRVIGSRGEHLRVVDSIAITQTSRLALVEVTDGDVYLLAVTNEGISLVDKITSEPAVDRIRGRKMPAGPARGGAAQGPAKA